MENWRVFATFKRGESLSKSVTIVRNDEKHQRGINKVL